MGTSPASRIATYGGTAAATASPPTTPSRTRGYTTACWIWQKTIRPDGYPGAWVDGESLPAYRAMYMRLVGPIPEGLQLDHLCRVRACVNPHHLEPVTAAENNRRTMPFRKRKTHCAQGHELTPENTITNKKGHRRCRTCKSADNVQQGRRRWGGARAAKRDAAQGD